MSSLCALAPQLLVIREPVPGFFERFPALLIVVLIGAAIIAAAASRK